MKELLNLPDFVKIGLMAFIFIWLANYGLTAAGLGNYTTSQGN
jgi:hypothetical protein